MSKLLNDRLEVGQRIATPLRSMEAAIDTAIEEAGHVMIAMAAGRKQARVAAATGQDAFANLGTAVQALFDGRSAIVACHQSLEETRRDLGVPFHSYGDVAPKPRALEAEPLRAVG